MRYFVELKYDGGAYCGWQRQPSGQSVQNAIEDAISRVLREQVLITGAGRTDTGVNASYYVAHFDVDHEIDTAQLRFKLNMMLAKDISIDSIQRVDDMAHARYHATEREYTYFISFEKNAFLRSVSWMYYHRLDVEKMNEAASKLLEYEDFTSFAKLNSNNKTNICHIRHAQWTLESENVLRFTIRADRFLRNMVRSIVGTLVDVGRGRYTPEDFARIIEARDLSRSSAGAPAQGLFLSDIVYPEQTFVRTVHNPSHVGL